MHRRALQTVVLIPTTVLTLLGCASAASVLDGITSAGTDCVGPEGPEESTGPAENTSDPAQVLAVRAAIEEFNDSVGEVDLDGIYERLPDEADVEWARYKSEVYEASRGHLGEVLAHTDYAGDITDAETRASPADIDHVVLAFSHVSYFQYAYAFFNERETPYMIFDDDYIFVDEPGAHAEVYIVPNPDVDGSGGACSQEYVWALIEDQRPIELNKAQDGSWVIDAGTLAPEQAENYLEVGDEWLWGTDAPSGPAQPTFSESSSQRSSSSAFSPCRRVTSAVSLPRPSKSLGS